MKKTIKVIGYSEGDDSVGISSIGFEFDTGLDKLTELERNFIRDTIIRAVWELHDNGDINYWFSDEDIEIGRVKVEKVHKFGYKDVEKKE